MQHQGVALSQCHENHSEMSQCETVKDKYRAYCFSENKLEICLESSRFKVSNFSTDMSTSSLTPKKVA